MLDLAACAALSPAHMQTMEARAATIAAMTAQIPAMRVHVRAAMTAARQSCAALEAFA